MVQGLSLSTLTSRNGGFYGSTSSWRRHITLMKKTHIGNDRHCFWNQFVQSLHFRGNLNILRQRNLRVEAGWLFKEGDQGLDASSERSENANEDILFFFFQLDLATRVQCALNMEYDIAQQIRNKLNEVEEEITRNQDAKKGSSSKSEAQEKDLSIICLRADLQNTIESENYALAAALQDQISKLEAVFGCIS